ncbi:hypothetical protein EVAR_43225_1 [Eumeta japonica]|uniref:Uncharacterized protein n=1 Tax=Eumeta variegata TaxID=151549 RepID=A0A4C1WTL3_EUMVA|nr:hypothetical protein EVAR_43225_1 [Eumeta japonica]
MHETARDIKPSTIWRGAKTQRPATARAPANSGGGLHYARYGGLYGYWRSTRATSSALGGIIYWVFESYYWFWIGSLRKLLRFSCVHSAVGRYANEVIPPPTAAAPPDGRPARRRTERDERRSRTESTKRIRSLHGGIYLKRCCKNGTFASTNLTLFAKRDNAKGLARAAGTRAGQAERFSRKSAYFRNKRVINRRFQHCNSLTIHEHTNKCFVLVLPHLDPPHGAVP